MIQALAPKSQIVGDPSNANAEDYFDKQYDYLVGMFGADGNPVSARATLGVAPQAARVSVASVAGTVDLTASAPNSDDILLTGSLSITAFTIAAGRVIRVTVAASPTLVNSASVVTQTGANIALRVGDTFMLRATAANTVEVLGMTRNVRPGFAANRGSTQSIANNTATKIQFNNEIFDTNGGYDNATNYRFTPSVPGIYQVNLSAVFAAGVDQTLYVVSIYKNGTAAVQSSNRFSGAGDQGAFVGHAISMNGSTDYIEAFVTQVSGGAINLATASYFSAQHVAG